MRSKRNGLSYVYALTFLAVACLFLLPACKGKNEERSSAAPKAASEKDIKEAQKLDKKKVLLVHSYHPEYEWVASLSFGVLKALSGSGVEIETFYMDTKRKTSLEWKTEMGRQALEIVDDWKPDIVITTDDNAQEYFGKIIAARSGPPLVFCGVNNPIEKYGYPTPSVTGVKEQPHMQDTIDFFRRLRPKASRFLFLTDDSPTSDGVLHYIQKQNGFEVYKISIERPSTFDEWKSVIKNIDPDLDAIMTYVYHTVKKTSDSDAKVHPNEVIQWTVDNSSVPIIALFSFTIDGGAVGGVVESGSEHGFEAGKMALKILKGVSPAEIPVKEVLKGTTMINIKSAERFGIPIPESEINKKGVVMTGR